MAEITRDELNRTLSVVPNPDPLGWFKAQPPEFQQEIAYLIAYRSIAAAKAKIKRVLTPKTPKTQPAPKKPLKQKIKKPLKHRKVVKLNMMGSIVAKIVRVFGSRVERIGLSIDTHFGAIVIKSPRSDVKYLIVFVRGGAIVSQSLSTSLHGVKASIGARRNSYECEGSTPYVYELIIKK